MRPDGTLSVFVQTRDSAGRRKFQSVELSPDATNRLYHSLGLALTKRGVLMPLETEEEERLRLNPKPARVHRPKL